MGPCRLLTLWLCVWSVAQAAAGTAGGLSGFIAARLALGVGESPLYLAGTKVCSNWFQAPSRAFPIGMFIAADTSS